MDKKNLLIVGATSGIMVSCLEKFLNEGYFIFASYREKQSLQNIPAKILLLLNKVWLNLIWILTIKI